MKKEKNPYGKSYDKQINNEKEKCTVDKREEMTSSRVGGLVHTVTLSFVLAFCGRQRAVNNVCRRREK